MRRLIKRVYLEADSPRRAFYELTLEEITDGYLVRKRSGASDKVLHRECWFRERFEEAEKLFERIVRKKTTPGRKRTYRPVPEGKAPAQLKLPL